MEALSLNYTVSIPFAVFSLASTLPPYWCKRSGIFFQYSPVSATLETCSGKYVPSSAISQSVSGRSLAATKSALAALPFTFTLWRLALALNRWNQPWLALKDALMLHRVSSSSLHEGFQISLESALSWVGLETDADLHLCTEKFLHLFCHFSKLLLYYCEHHWRSRLHMFHDCVLVL